MIEAIKNYIATCPYLDQYVELNVDYLVDKVKAYSINESAGYEPLISESITGEREYQLQFTFDSKLYWNDETANNINNSQFYENFRDWLQTNNDSGTLPTKTGITPLSIKATSNGYIYDAQENVAIYRISCVFNYIK